MLTTPLRQDFAGLDMLLESMLLTLTGKTDMGVILLEALLAVLVLIFVVWWTMFSGRKGGERSDDVDPK